MKKRGIFGLSTMLFCGTFVIGSLSSCQQPAEESHTYKLILDISDVKTEYFIGEGFTSYGLIVSLDDGSGSTKELTPSEYTVSIEEGAEFEEAKDEQEVIVTYNADTSVTAKYYINIAKSYSLSEVITHAQCQQGLVDVFYNIVFDFQAKRQLLGRIDFPTNTDVHAQAGFVVRIVYPAEIVDMSSYMMEFPERQINAG